MENIAQFIKSLGGLHDSTVMGLCWSSSDQRLEIDIKDIYWNFEGLPQYPGPTRAKFIFTHVTEFSASVDFTQVGLMIFDWTFLEIGTPTFVSQIDFSPSGKILVRCAMLECMKD